MSLKKMAAVGMASLGYATCSYVTFVALASEEPHQRDLFDDTLPKRIACVSSGPLFWMGIFGIALVEIVTEKFPEQLEKFIYDPPKKS